MECVPHGRPWAKLACGTNRQLCPRHHSYACASGGGAVLAGERFDSHGFIGIFFYFAGHLAAIRPLRGRPSARAGERTGMFYLLLFFSIVAMGVGAFVIAF